MNIIFLTNSCSMTKFNVEHSKTSNTVEPAQYFFHSIISGLSKYPYNKVICLSVIPQNENNRNKLYYKESIDYEENVVYYNMPIINVPFLRGAVNYLSLVLRLSKLDINNTILIADSLMYEVGGCVRFANNRKIKTVGIVTDLPDLMIASSEEEGLSRIINNACLSVSSLLLKKYDSYIFLTQHMNTYINKSNKPYCLIDCIASSARKKNKIIIKKDKPIVMYAGSLIKNYGIEHLANACEYLENECEVWLYGGNCDFLHKLKELEKKYNNLVIHDSINHDQLLQIEANVDILINPRPPVDFTFYSFPSKTIEYMQSGRPVLMFKLPCLSNEYDDCLFYIDEYTSKGIANSIKYLLHEKKEIINRKVKNAKKLVENQKSQTFQCNKIYDFLSKL